MLGLLGFVVRAEGRAVGRVLLGRSDAGMPPASGSSGRVFLRRGAAGTSRTPGAVVPGFGVGRRRSTHLRVDRVPLAEAGRTPTLHTKIDSAAAADRQVAPGAGAGRLP